MSLDKLNEIVLRNTPGTDYINKGSEISWAEEDHNFVVLADTIKGVAGSTIGGVDSYNPAEEYSDTDPDTYVTYNGNTYKYIGSSPSTGVTPGTDSTKWGIVSSGEFSHQQNTDTKLAQGTEFEVSAEEIKTFMASVGPGFDPDADYVFNGENEFTQPVIVPDAVEEGHAINKGQLDEAIDGVTIDESNLVHKDSDETITGIKTFSAPPVVPTAVNNNEAVNKLQMETAIAASQVGLLDLRGNYDASTNLFPSSGGSGTAGALLKADAWVVSVGGTLGGQVVQAGDWIIAVVDTPGQTSTNWAIVEKNIGYVPENSANKKNDLLTPSSTEYATTQAVVDGIGNIVGDIANITGSAWNTASGLFTKVGTLTQTFGSNKLNMTGGDGSFSNYMKSQYFTGGEDWSHKVSYVLNTVNTAGVAFGIETTYSNPIRFWLDTSTSGTSKLMMRTTSTSHQIATMKDSIEVLAGDTIEITINRQINRFTVYCLNVRSKVAIEGEFIFPADDSLGLFLPNFGYFSIYQLGGNNDVTIFNPINRTLKNPDFMFIGDSITQCYNSGRIENRFATMFAQATGKKVVVWAGAGNRCSDVTLGASEIGSIRPKNIILLIGTNDLNDAIGTIQTNYAAAITALQSYGINVIICTLLPRNNATTTSETTVNSWIQTTYEGTNQIIDLYNCITANTGYIPIVHPSSFAQVVLLGALLSNLGKFLTGTILPNNAGRTFSPQNVIQFVNAGVGASTGLQATVTNTDVAITVASTAGWPSSGIAIVANTSTPANHEIFYYYSKTETKLLGVVRGKHSTNPLTIASISGYFVYLPSYFAASSPTAAPELMVVNGKIIVSRTWIKSAGELLTMSGSSAGMRLEATSALAVMYIDRKVNSSYSNLQFDTNGVRDFIIATEPPDSGTQYLKIERTTGNNDLTLRAGNGNIGIGMVGQVAKLEIVAGTASIAPLKLNSGTNLTTPVNGAFEFDGTNLYFTTGGVRKTVTLV